MRVAVFCSCNDQVSPLILAEIESLGEALAKDGHVVVYGGATGGCMGRLAEGVRAHNGHLVGVLPEMDFMDGLEHPGLSERHVVDNLSSRKTMMNDLADAFIIYPGGMGTLDEAFELHLYSKDASLIRGQPTCVVLPETTEEVAGIVRLAKLHLDHLHAGHPAGFISQDADRIGQPLADHAFRDGVVQLLGPRR